MATTIGEATIKLTFDNKELDKSADKAQSKVKSFLGTLGTTARIGGKFLAGAFIAAGSAVSALGTASVKAYAETEQLVGGVETLFGESADQMLKYAKQAYKTAQISAAEFMDTSIQFSASLVQGLGGDTAKAADYANRAIIDMADNANKMGTDISRIQDAYRGFARQQYNMLDNLALGYGGTKTEMERLISDAAKMKDEQAELNVVVDEGSLSFDNIINAISVVQKHMGIAGTSAEEAAHTIQGSFNSMKAAAKDLITGLADPSADLGQLMDNFVNTVVGTGDNDGVIANLEPAIERTLTSIATIIEKGVPKLAEMLPGLLEKTLPSIATAAVAVITAITKVLPTLAPVLADGLSVLVEELVPYLPQIIGALIEGLATFFIEGWKHTFQMYAEFLAPALEVISAKFQEIINKIMSFFQPLIDFVRNVVVAIVAIVAIVGEAFYRTLIEPIINGIKSLVEWVKSWLIPLVEWIKTNVVDKIAGFFSRIFGGVKDGARGLGETLKNIFATVAGVMKTPINGLIDGINKILSKINLLKVPDWVPGIGGQRPNFAMIPKLAQGGIATRATGAMIGEAGTEAVIPLERNTGNWAGLLASAIRDEFESEEMTIGNGMTVYMTNNINNNLDADEIGQRLMTSIRRAA